MLSQEFLELHQRRRAAAALAEYAHEHGIRGATVSVICQIARMSRATFYAHFGGISDLHRFALQDAFDQVFEPLRTIEPEPAPWLEKLEERLSAFISAIEEEPLRAELCLVHSFVVEQAASDHGYEAVVALMSEAMEGGREAARTAGGDDPPAHAEEFLARSVVSLASLKLSQKRVEELREHLPALVMLAGGAFFERGAGAWREWDSAR